jgi:hypothetical protein
MATSENIKRLKTRRREKSPDTDDFKRVFEGDPQSDYSQERSDFKLVFTGDPQSDYYQERSDLPPRPPDEAASPDPDERKEFESREDYRGYKMPKGMSLPQRRAYKKAIDERENFRSKAARQLPFVAGEAVESMKGFGRSAKEIGKGIGEFAVDAALTVPRAKAAMYTDPEGSEEFMGRVASGDREARKQLATGASESMVEPAATMGDAALAKYAAEEGKYGEAALYGGMVLLPGVLQLLGKSMSKGWLKSAAEAGEEIPDEAAKKMNDLAKRVDEGKVTDDMQIRRELAGIEDAHASDYQASLGERDTDFDFESVSGKPPGGGGSVDERRDFRRSLYTKEGVDAADLEFRRALYTKKTFPEAMEVVERRFMLNSEPFKRVMSSEIAGVEPSIEDLRALTSIEADELKSRFVRQLRRTDQEAQQFMDRLESLKNTDKPPGGGGESTGNVFLGQRQDSYTGRDKRLLDYLINNAEPEQADAIEYVENLFKQGKLTKDEAMKEFDVIGEQIEFDAYVDPDAYPNFSRPQTMYDRAKAGGGTPGGGGGAKLSGIETYDGRPIEDVVGDIESKSRDEIRYLVDDFNSRVGVGKKPDPVDYGLPADYRDPAISGGTPRGGRSVDDIEGPSEAEIQQMIETSRFGDPEELEMLKEDMRRMAELEQGAQIESGRVRRSRTPGAAGASGKVPEGTSRAERKGTVRERPKKKD